MKSLFIRPFVYHLFFRGKKQKIKEKMSYKFNGKVVLVTGLFVVFICLFCISFLNYIHFNLKSALIVLMNLHTYE